jgi:hypothetical protein
MFDSAPVAAGSARVRPRPFCHILPSAIPGDADSNLPYTCVTAASAVFQLEKARKKGEAGLRAEPDATIASGKPPRSLQQSGLREAHKTKSRARCNRSPAVITQGRCH